MNKISAKSIQIFIAGALALIGFHAIIRAPYFLANSNHIALASDIFECFGLLIGIAMLFGNARAIWWARIFLFFAGYRRIFRPDFFQHISCVLVEGEFEFWKRGQLPDSGHSFWTALVESFKTFSRCAGRLTLNRYAFQTFPSAVLIPAIALRVSTMSCAQSASS